MVRYCLGFCRSLPMHRGLEYLGSTEIAGFGKCQKQTPYHFSLTFLLIPLQ